MNNLRRKLQQWRALQSWERRLLIKLSFLLPMTWLALSIFGFNRARRMAEFELPDNTSVPNEPAMERAQRIAQLAAIASSHGIYKANCLKQSLVLCWLLRRQGMPAQIKIGVIPNVQPFQAHAWVELVNIPLGQQVNEYRPFDHLPLDHEKPSMS